MVSSTLYRFQVDLSDVDRDLYRTLEFRAAMHPSESLPFFTIRVLAYCLNYREGLEFTAGIGSPEEPAMRVLGPTGALDLWIDIGNPDPRRIHKASKASREVRIYTHKDARMLAEGLREAEVHRLEAIGLYSMDPRFLNGLGGSLKRDNRWEMTHNGGELYLGGGSGSWQGGVENIPWEDRGPA